MRCVLAAMLAITGFMAAPAASTQSAFAATKAISQKAWADVKDDIEDLMGTPYVYGGRSTSGWDCSGFVSYVMHEIYGTGWPGGSWGEAGTDAIASYCSGSWVADGNSASDYNSDFADGTVKPGDIIVFSNSSGATVHAAIAGEDGTIYHAWHEGVGTVHNRFDYVWGINGGHGKVYASYDVYRGLESQGYAAIVKVSANPEVTEGNPLYSLAGAVYGVYRDAGCTDKAAEIVTDATGKGVSVRIEPGRYYVRETKASPGYALDPAVRVVDVKGGETASVKVTEIPKTDPIGMLVSKADATSGPGTAQGAATLAGAQFTVSYYAGDYASAAEAEASGEPTRQWVFETDEDGFAYFSDEYKVAGPSLYYQSDGATATIPQGCVVIEETKAPEGYNLDDGAGGAPGKHFARIMADEGPAESFYAFNTPEVPDTVQRGDYRLVKLLPTTYDDEDQAMTKVPVQGVLFEIVNMNDGPVVSPDTGESVEPGGVVLTIETDENGFATTAGHAPDGWTGALAYGEYRVHEVIPEDVAARVADEHGVTMLAVEDWMISISAEGQYDPVQIVENRIPQTPLVIEKVDATTGKAIPISASFQLFDGSGELVTYLDRTTGEIVDTWTTLESGRATLPMKLEEGRYSLVEVSAPEGYVLGGEPVEFEVDEWRTWDDPLVVSFENEPAMGEVLIMKTDADSPEETPVPGAEYCVKAAEDIVTGDGTLRVPAGEIVGYVTTGEDGTALVEGLFLGSYLVYETKSPEGWALDTGEHMVSIEYAGQTVPVVRCELGVSDEATTASILKVSSADGSPLFGAVFEIVQVEVGEDGAAVPVEGGFSCEIVTGEDGGASVTHLPHGVFAVTEVSAPEGYVASGESILVAVDDQGLIGLYGEEARSDEVKLVFENEPAELRVSKVDATTGEELPGATLRLIDSQGQVVEEWVSGEEPHVISPILSGTYTLVETIAPEGYILSEESVEITIEEGKVLHAALMTNDYTKVDVSKVDIASGEELPGATLRIVDADGNVVEEWVSSDEPHRIEMFAPGWYTLVETMAPEGYLVANDVRFEVLATGEVQTVVMSDEPAPAPEEPGKGLPQTGDTVPVWAFALLGALALGAATVALATQRGSVKRIRGKASALMGGKR